MALVLSLTTIVIIAASVGGALVLVAAVLGTLLIRRHFNRQRLRHAERRRASTGERWGTDGALKDDSMTQRFSPGRLCRKPSQAVSQHPRDSWLSDGLLPSRQSSSALSKWAVENGSYVPRPHRLKKSKSSVLRESVILGNPPGFGARPSLSRTNTETTHDDGDLKRMHVTHGRKARLSMANGNAHIMSIVVTPDHRSHHGEIRDVKLETGQRNKWAGVRRSLAFSIKSCSPSKSPQKNRSSTTHDPGSVSQARCRRSLSVPHVPTNQTTSRPIPVIPTPSNAPQLLNIRKVRQVDNSPSRESETSCTTIGSSIFDGLSPNLRQDLREIQAGMRRPELSRTNKRRSSAPSLPVKPQLCSNYFDRDKPERQPSGASSQLLPSPVKPVIQIAEKPSYKNNSIETFEETATAIAPIASPEQSKVRTRDTPVDLSGLDADWDVFGSAEQMSFPSNTFENPGTEVAQTEHTPRARITMDDNDNRNTPTSARQPRVLQKKRTKQDDHAPLSFASVAYNSTAPLQTPIMLRGDLPQPSSAYSDPIPAPSSVYSDLIVQSKEQAVKTSGERRSVTYPVHTSHWSSSSAVFEPNAIEQQQKTASYLKRVPFGPRRMPSIPSQMSSAFVERPKSRVSHYATMPILKPQTMFQKRKSGSTVVKYRFEDASSDDEDGLSLPVIDHSINRIEQDSHVDPPPVRLDPTSLRQSFYGYEATPSFIQRGTKNAYTTNGSSGNEAKEQLPVVPARLIAIRDSTAPRPPSNLSNSFRLSASTASSSEPNRNSYCSSLVLASSPPLEQSSKNIQPLSFPSLSSALTLKDTRRPISVTSMFLNSDQESSASTTPLKDYSEFCDLFPQPLSISSDSRPPTWLTTHGQEATSRKQPTIITNTPQICTGSPRPIPRGLPPNPRYYLDQRTSASSNDHVSNTRYTTRPEKKMAKTSVATTGKHSPLRRSIAHMSSNLIQTPPSSSQLSVIPTPRAGTPLTLQIVNSLRRTDSAYRDLDDKGSLHRSSIPIDLKIGSPTPFVANQTCASLKTKTGRRGRQMSPSPSPQGRKGSSAGSKRDSRVQEQPNAHGTTHTKPQNPFGAIGEGRPKDSDGTIAQESIQKNSRNMQLKQRIEDAKRRKVLTQQQSNQQDVQPQKVSSADGKENRVAKVEDKQTATEKPIGLGITIPKRKADIGFDTGYWTTNANTESSSGSKRRRSSARSSILEVKGAGQSGQQVTRQPSPRRVRFSETSKVFGDRDSNGSQGMVYAVSFYEHGHGQGPTQRISTSPGRIWREEVF